ncbi:MAG: YlxM family DNA-binding protein [Lachnospiraceae bacterium]|nr:YlxM family DNA-binding protein [Lachnospiraceae bacterium]
MEKIVQQGLLYDFYGELLTDHQKQVYERAVYENYSLGEIADEMGISRQAVHDLIKRCDRILEEYEDKLGLMKKFGEIRERVESIKSTLGEMESPEYGFDSEREEAVRLCDEIVDLL